MRFFHINNNRMWKLIYASAAILFVEIIVLTVAIVKYEPPRTTNYHRRADTNAHVEVTNTVVQRKLSALGELATYSYSYSGDITYTADKDWFIFNSLTESTVYIEYEGEIKAGIDVAGIDVYVDQDEQVIYITLPRPIVISNNITSTEYSEDISVFGEVSGDTSDALLDEAREDELDEAIDCGLMDYATINAQEAIEDLLSIYDDYEVVFVSYE